MDEVVTFLGRRGKANVSSVILSTGEMDGISPGNENVEVCVFVETVKIFACHEILILLRETCGDSRVNGSFVQTWTGTVSPGIFVGVHPHVSTYLSPVVPADLHLTSECYNSLVLDEQEVQLIL